MRAVIYARYSSELQREASIEDQVRLCKTKIATEGWKLAATLTDAAQSGANRLRPGYQRMLMEARGGEFEVIVAEALDRLSRDQEDVAALYKHLSFAGVKLVTMAEGEINELHVGLKGTMNALFLKDLAQKVRRGLEGRVRQGRSGGGLCYGYDVIIEYDSRGERVHGGRRINDAQAGIVRRIFTEFARGTSPRAIAVALNAEGIPGPHGKPWGMSTIYGNWRRGTGILNNELYIGRLVWNRQRFVKDPSTGKRQAKPNPSTAWVVENVPELRIVTLQLWQEVKERQQKIRREVIGNEKRVRSERARRPAYLLSGLLRCGGCGGGFSKVSTEHYGCSSARNRGTCTNLLTIRRDVIEATVLSGLKTHLMHPDLTKEFIAEYHRELNRRNAVRDSERELHATELARIDRQIRAIIEAIKDGMRSAAMKDELAGLEQRREELTALIRQTPAPVPRLHPNLSEIYRQKVARLQEELNRQELRAEAAEILRSLISEVRLVPENEKLEVELAGDLAGILALTSGNKKPATDCGGLQVTLVAGACNHR